MYAGSHDKGDDAEINSRARKGRGTPFNQLKKVTERSKQHFPFTDASQTKARSKHRRVRDEAQPIKTHPVDIALIKCVPSVIRMVL